MVPFGYINNGYKDKYENIILKSLETKEINFIKMLGKIYNDPLSEIASKKFHKISPKDANDNLTYFKVDQNNILNTKKPLWKKPPTNPTLSTKVVAPIGAPAGPRAALLFLYIDRNRHLLGRTQPGNLFFLIAINQQIQDAITCTGDLIEPRIAVPSLILLPYHPKYLIHTEKDRLKHEFVQIATRAALFTAEIEHANHIETSTRLRFKILVDGTFFNEFLQAYILSYVSQMPPSGMDFNDPVQARAFTQQLESYEREVLAALAAVFEARTPHLFQAMGPLGRSSFIAGKIWYSESNQGEPILDIKGAFVNNHGSFVVAEHKKTRALQIWADAFS